MDIKKAFACCVLGFSLGQAFNVATNPLGNQGFVASIETAVTQPAVVVYSAVERPGGVLAPLVIAGAAGLFIRGRKKKADGPAPDAAA